MVVPKTVIAGADSCVLEPLRCADKGKIRANFAYKWHLAGVSGEDKDQVRGGQVLSIRNAIRPLVRN